ncbi:MAG: response regulator [Proteobacteria bacterium]|nr:response regulator [Pseudomonadota bacterium]
MISAYQHRVLVVDDEAQVGKAIGRLLAMEKLEYVYADSGESALDSLKKASCPFSLIISDQKMPGMKGTQFLEHAKRLNPDTIRFLITGYSEMQTIINAVNKGSIQRYISKPWDNDEIIKAIRSGISQYEHFMDNEKLVSLAKKQNAKLYELNCELMEAAKAHGKELTAMDAEIEAIETQIKELSSQAILGPARLAEELQTLIGPGGEKGQQILTQLFSQTIQALYTDFRDLALGNGFEMPPPGTGRACD